MSPEGQWFARKGCTRCHTISSSGVHGRPGPQRAPDLSDAAEDVPRRYGIELEQFLAAPPSGTMSMVLRIQIPLSREEQAEAARRLREAARRRGERDGGAAR